MKAAGKRNIVVMCLFGIVNAGTISDSLKESFGQAKRKKEFTITTHGRMDAIRLKQALAQSPAAMDMTLIKLRDALSEAHHIVVSPGNKEEIKGELHFGAYDIRKLCRQLGNMDVKVTNIFNLRKKENLPLAERSKLFAEKLLKE
jgi:hypothetical protein